MHQVALTCRCVIPLGGSAQLLPAAPQGWGTEDRAARHNVRLADVHVRNVPTNTRDFDGGGTRGGLGAQGVQRIFTRLGLRTLYIFGLLGLAACTFAYAVIPSPELLITARGLCGVGFSSTLLASVMAVRSMVPLELQATGQALLGAISFGLAVSIASLVGGVIYAQLGAETLFYLATLILLSAIPFAARILRNA